MKMPVTWHEENLKNFRSSLERKRKEFASLQNDVERMEKEAAFRESQINRAWALGKDSYDEDKFMQKKETL